MTTTAAYGNWLRTMDWQVFSTITYRKDISAKNNVNLMADLEDYLDKTLSSYRLFWTMERTHLTHTHNHMLLNSQHIIAPMEKFLSNRNLIDSRFVEHVPYDPALGAAYYVTKYLSRPDAEYNIMIKGISA